MKIVENGYVKEFGIGGEEITSVEIGSVEISLECRFEGSDVYYIASVSVFDGKGTPICNDNNLINGEEFHGKEDAVSEVSARYGISRDLIEIV